MTLKHEAKMSPDITRIEVGLKTRSAVKNLGLVAEALGVLSQINFGNKSNPKKKDLLEMRDSLDGYFNINR